MFESKERRCLRARKGGSKTAAAEAGAFTRGRADQKRRRARAVDRTDRLFKATHLASHSRRNGRVPCGRARAISIQLQ